MVRHRFKFHFVVFFFLLPLFAYAQQPSPDGERALRFQFNKTILASEDSPVLKQRRADDSLSELPDDLLRSTEEDSLEINSNKLIVSVDGRTHASYRGRDGGVSQSSVSPVIAYRLSSGLRFSFSAGWTDEPEFHRDGASAGVGYDFTLLPVLSASLGYSYLWFADSSTQNQSVFHHSIDGSLSLETSVINFGAGIGISIGKELEYAVNASFSRSLSFGTISVDPTLTVSWGEQNGILAETRIQKANAVKAHGLGKGKNIGGQQQIVTLISTPTNVFSIMSYEVVLPVNITLGRVLLVPSLTAVIPMNIIDGSRSLPYLNAGLTATVDWIW